MTRCTVYSDYYDSFPETDAPGWHDTRTNDIPLSHNFEGEFLAAEHSRTAYMSIYSIDEGGYAAEKYEIVPAKPTWKSKVQDYNARICQSMDDVQSFLGESKLAREVIEKALAREQRLRACDQPVPAMR